MTQIARNLTDADDPSSAVWNISFWTETRSRRRLPGSATGPWCEAIAPACSGPNLTAFAERFVGSVKSSASTESCHSARNDHRAAVRAFMDHYHEERPHQGLGNVLITPNRVTRTGPSTAAVSGSAACSSSIAARPRNPSAEFSHTTLSETSPHMVWRNPLISHARANVQSRFMVATETPSTSLASRSGSPENRSSTTRAARRSSVSSRPIA